MNNNQLQELRYQTLLLIDAIIEKENAFGMTFCGKHFEARYKCGNECAYQSPGSEQDWTFEECMELLGAVKEYIISL
jgi:hypothetical protein